MFSTFRNSQKFSLRSKPNREYFSQNLALSRSKKTTLSTLSTHSHSNVLSPAVNRHVTNDSRCFGRLYFAQFRQVSLSFESVFPRRSMSIRHEYPKHQKYERERKRSFSELGMILVGTVGVSAASFILWKLLASEVGCDEQLVETRLNSQNSLNLKDTIQEASDLILKVKDESGTPGIVVGVSLDGKNVWSEGYGFSDVENRVQCTPKSVMRIASISKSITMTAAAKLIEEGKLDLDKPIQHYVPSFPEKTVDGEKVTLTTRHLVSHLAGIRHYEKPEQSKKSDAKNEETRKTNKDSSSVSRKVESDVAKETGESSKKRKKVSEFSLAEYSIKKHYKDITSSLSLFKDDPLLHKPGTKFVYTTHGWTLVSAVLEKAAGEPFDKLICKLFKELGMEHTYLDLNNPIIYNRARFYMRDDKHKLQNTPYVDLSYKWAGGGFLSDVTDLLKFGDIMLYSYQKKEEPPIDSEKLVSSGKTMALNDTKPGYLKPETMRLIWEPVVKTECNWDKDGSYAMGWGVVSDKCDTALCRHQRFYVTHTGGAVGCSSALVILPHVPGELAKGDNPPKGVTVAIIANLTSVGLNKTALQIAKIFDKVDR